MSQDKGSPAPKPGGLGAAVPKVRAKPDNAPSVEQPADGPLYRAKQRLYLNGPTIEPGESFRAHGKPGRAWEPLDDAARKAVKAAFGDAEPDPKGKAPGSF
jgi:hypothetical protein